MFSLELLAKLSPLARVGTAIAPAVGALAFRLMMGPSRMASVLLWIASTWFLIMCMLTPLSAGMQVDLQRLRHLFD